MHQQYLHKIEMRQEIYANLTLNTHKILRSDQ